MRRLLLLGVAAATIGCDSVMQAANPAAPELKRVAAPKLAENWKAYSPDNKAFSLALPADWEVIDIESGTVRSPSGRSEFAEMLKTSPFKTLMAGAKGIIASGSYPGSALTMVTVSAKPAQGVTAKEAAKNLEEMQSVNLMGNVSATRSKYETPIGTAHRVSQTIDGGMMAMKTKTYFLADGYTMYILTFTSMEQGGEPFPTKAIMDTFRVK